MTACSLNIFLEMLWKIQEAKEMFTSRQINLGRCLPSSGAGICNIYRDFIKRALGEGDAAATTRTWRGGHNTEEN